MSNSTDSSDPKALYTLVEGIAQDQKTMGETLDKVNATLGAVQATQKAMGETLKTMGTVQGSILTRVDQITSPQAGYATAAKTIAMGITITAIIAACKPILFAYFIPH